MNNLDLILTAVIVVLAVALGGMAWAWKRANKKADEIKTSLEKDKSAHYDNGYREGLEEGLHTHWVDTFCRFALSAAPAKFEPNTFLDAYGGVIQGPFVEGWYWCWLREVHTQKQYLVLIPQATRDRLGKDPERCYRWMVLREKKGGTVTVSIVNTPTQTLRPLPPAQRF